jgi:hypothetical protein
LKRVLRQSPNVSLFRETAPIAALLVDDAYDEMATEPVTLAKTALLNTYFRLSRIAEPVSDDRTWFSFVTRLLQIGRERCPAFVEPAMEDLVRRPAGRPGSPVLTWDTAWSDTRRAWA